MVSAPGPDILCLADLDVLADDQLSAAVRPRMLCRSLSDNRDTDFAIVRRRRQPLRLTFVKSDLVLHAKERRVSERPLLYYREERLVSR